MSNLMQAVKSERRKERLKSGRGGGGGGGQNKNNSNHNKISSRSYSTDDDDTRPDQVKKVPFIKISSLSSALEAASKSKSGSRRSVRDRR